MESEMTTESEMTSSNEVTNLTEYMGKSITKLAEGLSQEQRDRLLPTVLLLLCKGIVKQPNEYWRCSSLLTLIRVCDPWELQDVFKHSEDEINKLLKCRSWDLCMFLASKFNNQTEEEKWTKMKNPRR